MAIVYNPNNLITAPVDFSSWTLSRATVTSAPTEVNPTGSVGDVYELRCDGTSGAKLVSKMITAPTFLSVYLKQAAAPIALSIGIGSANYVYYDTDPMTGGQLGTPGASIGTHSMTAVGNGWYLLKCTLISAGTRLALTFGSALGVSLTSTVTHGILVWGAFAYTADEAYYTDTGAGAVDFESIVRNQLKGLSIPFL